MLIVLLLITANLVRLGSVESVISVNRSSEHPECKHFPFFHFAYSFFVKLVELKKNIITLFSFIPLGADKLGQLGPSLGMKKSSSLESLQTMVQEVSFIKLRLILEQTGTFF